MTIPKDRYESEIRRFRNLVNRGLSDRQIGEILDIATYSVYSRRKRWKISRPIVNRANRVLIGDQALVREFIRGQGIVMPK